MAFIQSFEELTAWKKARDYSKTIQDICNSEPLNQHYKLRNALLTSSSSVMDHIADGFDRSWRCDFIDYLDNARGALAKSRSQLYRVFDCGYISEHVFLDFLKANLEVSKELVTLCDRVSNFEADPPILEEPVAAMDLVVWNE